jgi:mannonate dehydratase
VQGTLPHFHETYLNEGSMDMYKVMRNLRKVGFDGVLVGDHFPQMVRSAGPLGGQIYTIGYLQALIERADEEFQARGPA